MAAAGSSVARRVEELGDLAQAHIQQLNHFLIRASAALEKLKLLCGEEKKCSNPSNLLELYTQAILDMTYFEENKLVDEDFPEDSSQKVKELITFLSEPEILVKENNMYPKHCDLLGDELLECLSWRRGALLYMYCHSLTKRREWLTRKSGLLKEYLVDGISYLLQMLNYRCPTQLDEGVSFQDLDTAKLLSEGIFSDIHLLAMMYSGEMCYWGLKHCADQQPENQGMDAGVSGASCTTHTEPLDFREVGERILKNRVSDQGREPNCCLAYSLSTSTPGLRHIPHPTPWPHLEPPPLDCRLFS
ncbi:RAB7A-interacting MON1-CCZ1 complex subunit 1 isoform X2 [Myotis daubentonii]|uniref:RAB7A-interacting MON1-CCZ1 complex subunit 1 isoform X2 n=1 Tax=Myotis daubentonii TaxID=98922 RepID=UPI002872B808|nr:RAB7A-interacting MON1-CCZ1 complex subunit 1 isoform X2 [Myotis daubentonii]